MRIYVVEISSSYAEREVSGGFMSSRKPLYREMDKRCYISCCPMERMLRVPLFTVIVFNRPFVDNTEYVKYCVARACRIWEFSYDDHLKEHLKVREATAKEALDEAGQQSGVTASSSLSECHAFELYLAACRTISSNSFLLESMVVKGNSHDERIRRARMTEYGPDLEAELERIHACGPVDADGGRRTPVHYIMEGLDSPRCEVPFDLLMDALNEAGRLPSSHVYRLRFSPLMKESHVAFRHGTAFEWLNENLIDALSDNVLVIEYGEGANDADFDFDLYRMFMHTIEMLNDSLDSVQVVFLLPFGSDFLQERIRRAFMAPLVTIARSKGTAAWRQCDASERLVELARASDVETNSSLESLLERYRCNRVEKPIEDVFSDWMALERARQNFPVYASSFERFYQSSNAADDAYSRLDSLVGLEKPKRLVREIVGRLRMNKLLAQHSLPVRPFSMHMIFSGSPGTGKTEVARLYGEILRIEGVLPEGRLMVISGSDVAPGFERTFARAKGSILFIDEAYSITSSVGLAELIALMESHREDTVVILAGYSDRMEKLIENNPGFRSRIGFTVEFDDYTREQLCEIFELMAKRAGLRLEDGVIEAVRDEVSKGGRRDDQGNARFVRRLYEDVLGAQQMRLSKIANEEGIEALVKDDLRTIKASDVVSRCAWKQDASDAKSASATLASRERLERLIGLADVKRAVLDRLSYARVQKIRRDLGMSSEFIPIHMAFLGNPGTGKTEVARLVARILKEEGVLSVGDLYECSRKDLTSCIVGETSAKVYSLFKRARGSVIFIDEAYSLIDGVKGGVGDEAITAIVDCMEKLRDEVVVIFAGYTKEMGDLISLNPGLASRVKVRISFPNYSKDELWSILELMADEWGMNLADGVRSVFDRKMAKAMQRNDFGNARSVRTFLEDAMVAQAARLVGFGGIDETFDVADERLSTLEPCDFERSGCASDTARRSVGFVS